MANWRGVHTKKFFPTGLGKALDGMQKANAALATALGVTEKYLRITTQLARVVSANPVEMALRAAIEEIQAFIDGIKGNTGVHAIMIPIQKNLLGVLKATGVDRIDITPYLNHIGAKNSRAGDIAYEMTPDTIRWINDTTNATGGNAGFWRELAISLRDEGDIARPLFPSNYAVTGVAVVMGAVDVAPIYAFNDLFMNLLNFGVRADMAARTQPIAGGLRARVIPIPGENRLGVQLDWTPVPVLMARAAFFKSTLKIKEIIIVRGQNPLLRERFLWHQNFPTPYEPVEYKENIKEYYVYKTDKEPQVLARIKNDGFIARYVDSVPLEDGKHYYYALSLVYEVDGVGAKPSQFSNVAHIHYRQRWHTTRGSEPPDWFYTPALITLFPVLQDIVGKAELYLAGLLTRTTINSGIGQLVLQTLRQIEMLLLDAKRVAASLKRLESMVRLLAQQEIAGMRATTITVERGGMQAWMRELAHRLSDTKDPSRPPYDHQELVAGFIILAGAPREPRLQPIRDLLELFFGEGEKHPLEDVLATMDVITQPGPPLYGAPPGIVLSDPTRNPIVGFDQSMQPIRTADVAANPDAAPETKDPTRPVVFDGTLTPSTRADGC